MYFSRGYASTNSSYAVLSQSELTQKRVGHRRDCGVEEMLVLSATNEGGKLAGALLFYLLRRDEKGGTSSSPGIPEPLLNPTFDGKVLGFQVSHRRAHPPRTLADPPANFLLKLTATNKDEFVNKSEDSPVIQLIRSDY